MSNLPRPQTLQLRWPFGKTLALSLSFFCLFYLAGELIAHTNSTQALFISQSWGSRHRAFERQLSRLDKLFNQEGHIDCIFLGNSMVWRGFDPEAFQKGYLSQTGEELRCFNFGVDGMPASNAGALAKVLVEDYQPQLLIYGVDARDFAVPIDANDAKVLAELPWLQYRMGKFSLKGWFIEHSALYRYRTAIQHWLRFDYRYTARSDPDNTMASRYGFVPDTKVGDIQKNPDPRSSDGQIKYYFDLLSDYVIRQENLDGLRQVLNLTPDIGGILIVEMPVPDTYTHFFGNEQQDYQRYIDQVAHLTQEYQVPFWRTNSWEIIPTNGWVDYSHLNQTGAAVFSHALGVKVGEAVQAGLFQKPIQQISSKSFQIIEWPSLR